jgi:hypothetical protein
MQADPSASTGQPTTGFGAFDLVETRLYADRAVKANDSQE